MWGISRLAENQLASQEGLQLFSIESGINPHIYQQYFPCRVGGVYTICDFIFYSQ